MVLAATFACESSMLRCAALKNICHPSERNHRPHEQRQISVKGNQRAERNLPTQQLMSALPQHNQKRYADQRLQRWHEHAPGANQLDVSRDVLAVRFIKTALFCFFLRVSSYHAHA